MIQRAFVLTAALAVLALTGAEQAHPQTCQGRPGASAIEQYCEAIPDGTGGRQTSSDRGSSTPGGGVPGAAGSDLRAAGRDGAAVLALVATGGTEGSSRDESSKDAPRDGSTTGSGDSSATAEDQESTPAVKPPSDNPLRAVQSAASNGATIGAGFVWGLVALTLLSLVVGWIGFRQRRTPS